MAAQRRKTARLIWTATLALASASTVPAPARAAQTTIPTMEVVGIVPAAPPQSTRCELDRDARPLRALKGKQLRAAVTVFTVVDESEPPRLELALAATCDQERFARGAPGLSIGGTLTGTRHAQPVVGAGYWAVTTIPQRRYGPPGLLPGDHLVLPATGTSGTAAVWVQSRAGTRKVDLPGGAAATVDVQASSPEGVKLVVTQGGASRTLEVPPVPRATPVVRGRRSGRRVTVTMRGLPHGANAMAMTSDQLRAASARNGRVTLQVKTARRTTAKVYIAWADVTTRASGIFICTTRPGRRPVACRQDARRASLAALSTNAAASTPLPAHNLARALAHRRAPTASTQDATRLSHAPRPIDPVPAARRFPMLSRPLDVGPSAGAVGDINGDGHADLLGAGGETELKLRLSTPDGGLQPAIPFFPGSATPAGDVDGDGHLDTLLQGGTIAFGTGQWTDLGPASSAPPGDPRVLALTTEDGDALLGGPDAIAPLPDVTGDGRPELGIVLDGSALILGSRSLGRGQAVMLPNIDVETLTTWDLADGYLGAKFPLVLPERDGTVALRVDQQRSPRATIERFDSTGRRIARSTAPQLDAPVSGFIRDPGSGDLVVETERSGKAKRTITRLTPEGTVRARTTTLQSGSVVFGPDGPDPDTDGELFIQDRERLLVLPSATSGRIAARQLPVVTDAAGKALSGELSTRADGTCNGLRCSGGELSLTVRTGLTKGGNDRWSRLLLR